MPVPAKFSQLLSEEEFSYLADRNTKLTVDVALQIYRLRFNNPRFYKLKRTVSITKMLIYDFFSFLAQERGLASVSMPSQKNVFYQLNKLQAKRKNSKNIDEKTKILLQYNFIDFLLEMPSSSASSTVSRQSLLEDCRSASLSTEFQRSSIDLEMERTLPVTSTSELVQQSAACHPSDFALGRSSHWNVNLTSSGYLHFSGPSVAKVSSVLSEDLAFSEASQRFHGFALNLTEPSTSTHSGCSSNPSISVMAAGGGFSELVNANVTCDGFIEFAGPSSANTGSAVSSGSVSCGHPVPTVQQDSSSYPVCNQPEFQLQDSLSSISRLNFSTRSVMPVLAASSFVSPQTSCLSHLSHSAGSYPSAHQDSHSQAASRTGVSSSILSRRLARCRSDLRLLKRDFARLTAKFNKSKAEVLTHKKSIRSLKLRLKNAQSKCPEVDMDGKLDLRNDVQKSYNFTTRLACYKLASLGIPVDKIGASLAIVTECLFNIPLKYTPTKKTVSRMLRESFIFSKIQVACLLRDCRYFIVHSDGTTKDGRKFLTLELSIGLRTYHVAVKEEVSENADTLKEFVLGNLKDLADLVRLLSTDELTTLNWYAIILSKLVATVSDRGSVERTLAKSLALEKGRVLPVHLPDYASVIEEYESEDEILEVLQVFCFQHVSTSCAQAVDKVLHKYEKENNVEASSFARGSSAVVELIKAACTVPFKDSTGAPGKFQLFCKNREVKIILRRFSLTRFLNIFHNGAAVFYLRDCLLEFIEEHCSQRTSGLFLALKSLLENDLLVAGARVLGLINVFVIGPFFFEISSKNMTALQAGDILVKLVHTLKDVYLSDLNSFLSGSCGPPFPGAALRLDDDPVSASLISFSCDFSEPVALHSYQMLEVSLRAVADCLESFSVPFQPGGDFYNPSVSIRSKLGNCPAQNSASERSFSIVDTIVSRGSSSTQGHLDGVIGFRVNHSDQFFTSLEPAVLQKCCSIAFQIGRELFEFEPKRNILLNRARWVQMEQDASQAVEREAGREGRRAKVVADVESYGGLWTSVDAARGALEELGRAQQLTAIKSQLRFRKQILRQDADVQLLSFSSNGVVFSLSTLRRNLFSLIRSHSSDNNGLSPAEIRLLLPDGIVTKSIRHWRHFDSGPTMSEGVIKFYVASEGLYYLGYEGDETAPWNSYPITSAQILDMVADGQLFVYDKDPA